MGISYMASFKYFEKNILAFSITFSLEKEMREARYILRAPHLSLHFTGRACKFCVGNNNPSHHLKHTNKHHACPVNYYMVAILFVGEGCKD